MRRTIATLKMVFKMSFLKQQRIEIRLWIQTLPIIPVKDRNKEAQALLFTKA